ncbi:MULTISPECIES: alcohol dehydrogenase catalytic domain-containing protein [Actinoalloteichus]|uniref:Theronine dehydrogenase-like Zn-dependent dehydrogenase n=1 Tax=Actinoalloteichus fjordicus TaxID=1612552 RepID=A0AAC9LEK5_9PSEU|nr:MULTISPECIES: alcohol dehydrogenase catalytic domain-containing protein [Actinoalloteichus]APU16231.1 theronine dehydrogenase-like Zn-dependent dehydrogenase [Actinoalloteichus fjordicus]APU22291.1 theronine dehydrogenase-like Zn-dependent dehydrogenase [Actinoalloteichus sp. GBA129-24]
MNRAAGIDPVATKPAAVSISGTGTHRAIVRTATATALAVADRPTIIPGPGELSIATEVAGVCGTDIQLLRGLRADPATVIGHEGIGRIAAVGVGTDPELTAGTLVVINPTHPTEPSFLLGHNIDGLWQERTLVPATAVRGGLVLPLPATTDPGLAPLLEPLAVAGYALEAFAPFDVRTLVIIGDGTVGHLAVRAARRRLGPAVRTVLVHHTPAGLRFSEAGRHRADVLVDHGRLTDLRPGPGGVAVLLATPRDATIRALDAVLAMPLDGGLVIDVVGGLPPGTRSAMLPGVDLVALRAANCGGLPDPIAIASVTSAAGRRVRILGHRGVANRHLLDAAAELARDPERYRELVTHETDLDGAVGVLRLLARSRNRVVDGRRLVKLAIRFTAGRVAGRHPDVPR